MNKKSLVKEIKKELKETVSYFDIFSVVNILIDELRKELMDTGKVVIPNFGKFIIKTFKPKVIKNVVNGEFQLTKPYSSLRFVISKNMLRHIKTEICEKNAIK